MFEFMKKKSMTEEQEVEQQIEENAKAQKQRTIEHLEKYGSITSLEAIYKYGNTRLSGTMFCLKKSGYKFKTRRKKVENRWGKYTYVTEYYIEKGGESND